MTKLSNTFSMLLGCQSKDIVLAQLSEREVRKMSNTTTVNSGRQKIRHQKDNIKRTALELTHSSTIETDFILSHTEKTFQAETKSKSYGADNGLAKWASLLATFFGRITNWLNSFGSNEIDVQRMESRHSQQPGFRKWNL